jgi:hypothetical protein
LAENGAADFVPARDDSLVIDLLVWEAAVLTITRPQQFILDQPVFTSIPLPAKEDKGW